MPPRPVDASICLVCGHRGVVTHECIPAVFLVVFAFFSPLKKTRGLVYVVCSNGRYIDKDGFQLTKSHVAELEAAGRLRVVESHTSAIIHSMELLNGDLQPLPCVDGNFVVVHGEPFYVRYVVEKREDAPSDLGIVLTVDGQKLQSVQPITSPGTHTIIVPGFSYWKQGHLFYLSFLPTSSRTSDAASATTSAALVGTVGLEVFACRFRTDPARPSSYSSTGPVRQAETARPGGDRKFFETPGTTAAPGGVKYRTKGVSTMTLEEQGGVPIATMLIRYDTATNLELRGILNREQHAHLLPPDEMPPKDPRPQEKRRPRDKPISEFVEVTTIDLLDPDNPKVTVEKRPRKIHDLVE